MQQRTQRVIIAVGCAVALLLPVLSIFDNDFNDRDAFDDLAVAVTTFVIATALVALAIVEPERRSRAQFLVATLSDPRSPPRA